MATLKVRRDGFWVAVGAAPEEVTPDPPPAGGLPASTFYRGDPMTEADMDYNGPPWGQWSVEGPGGVLIEFRTDGPTFDGVQHNYRRLHKPAPNRRNEIGQVNNDDGFVYEVGGEYITRAWYRVPTDVDWAGSGDNQGAIMQMKQSRNVHDVAGGSAGAHFGYGGAPASSGPALGLKQNGTAGDNQILFGVRSDSGSLQDLWEIDIDHLRWFEMIYHVKYDLLTGFVNLYFRYEGEAPALVLEYDGPTVKENTEGDPMYSTYRTGCYDETGLARFVDAGPMSVDTVDP